MSAPSPALSSTPRNCPPGLRCAAHVPPSATSFYRCSFGTLIRTYFRCKVLFDEDSADETLNAEHVGADRYRLENIPFSALGVSRYDVVEAREHTGGMLTFVRVVAKSGHRTVRCVVDGSRTAATPQALVHELATRGLRCEALLNKYFTIDIPPGVWPDTIVDSCYHAWVAVEACGPPPPP